MTREEALEKLATRGIVGTDAQTALDHAMRRYPTVDEMLRHARDFTNESVMHLWGQDAGRVILALRAVGGAKDLARGA